LHTINLILGLDSTLVGDNGVRGLGLLGRGVMLGHHVPAGALRGSTAIAGGQGKKPAEHNDGKSLHLKVQIVNYANVLLLLGDIFIVYIFIRLSAAVCVK
jgi:hypothetical protein